MKIQQQIEKLKNVKLENVKIEAVTYINEGHLAINNSMVIEMLPKFFRVCVVITPSEKSYIRIELWLPEEWNGKFIGTGNGGSAGNILYSSLEQRVKQGYAVANTDMGTSPDVDLSIGIPERWADFGHRATHLMTTVSKELIFVHYGRKESYSYFIGASTGGQQALSEAQRYGDDYDGIIAGVPANNRTFLHTYFLWNFQAMHTPDGKLLFNDEETQNINRLIIQYFQEMGDGTTGDNFITDPSLTEEILDRVIEKIKASTYGLTDAQGEALRRIYQGPVNPRTGERIYNGMPLGSEINGCGILDAQQLCRYEGLFYLFRWVFGKDYDYLKFDFDSDLDTLNQRLASSLNANNSDLSAFKAHGGKLIMYSGTADPCVPYPDALHYYERVVSKQGSLEKTQDFFRYFLMLGMSHGTDGLGTNYIGEYAVNGKNTQSPSEPLQALIAWVENGKEPEFLMATGFHDKSSKNGIRFQRPVYAYPKTAKYINGDPALPSSYIAVDGKRDNVLTCSDWYMKTVL